MDSFEIGFGRASGDQKIQFCQFSVIRPNSVIQWRRLMIGSVLLEPGLTSFEAELAGTEGLVHGLAYLFSCPALAGPTHGWFFSLLAEV